MRARLAAIAGLTVAALLFNLTGYPLFDPDEGRNAEVAREMAATGDYLHPRLDGLPYVDKPALFFAATAVFVKAFGASELTVRIPPLLFTFAMLALLWWWARRLFGEDAAWIAVVAAGASPLTLGLARTVIMDSALTLFVTAAMVGFYEAIEAEGRKGGTAEGGSSRALSAFPPYRLSALAWISLALGVLTKGPIALALPLMVVVPYATWRRSWRPLLDPVGILAFVAIVLPWVRTMSDAAPGYLRYVLVTETFQRLTTPVLERTAPWWYFVPVLVAAALPWSIVLLGAGKSLIGREGGKTEGRNIFLLLWVLVPLTFFSLSQSKRPQYVLPLIPPMGVIIAALWSPSALPPFRLSATLPGLRSAAISLAALGLFLVFGHSTIVGTIRGLTPAVAHAIHPTAFYLGVICIACAIGAWVARTRLDGALLALALPVIAIPFVSRPLLREIGRDRSAAELAQAIVASAPSQTEIVGVHAYPPSLPFYLGRLVILATPDARELTSNYLLRTADTWRVVPGSTLRSASWWREAAIDCDRPRVFVIRANDDEARALLAGTLPLIVETRKYVAYGPCGRVDLAGRLDGWTDGRMENSVEQPSAYPPIRLSATK